MADIGSGTTFEVETAAGSGVFTLIADITHITPPGESTDSIDVTDMDSGDVREFIPGLTDPGEVGLDLIWDASSASDDFLHAWRVARERRSAKITFPNNTVWTFSAFPTNYQPDVPLDDKQTASWTGKCSGSTVRT